MMTIAGGIILAVFGLAVIYVALLNISDICEAIQQRPRPPKPTPSQYPQGYQTMAEWLRSNQ